MTSQAKKFISGSLLKSVNFAANAIVGILLLPFIIHSLGDKLFGLWAVIGTLVGYYSLMDFGLGSAIERYISRSAGTKDDLEANKIANTGLVILAWLGVAALVISAVLAFFVPILIKNVTETGLFRAAVLILGVNFSICFPFGVFVGILEANMRYDRTASVQIAKLIVKTALIIVFLNAGYGIIALAVITCVTDIAGYLLVWYFVSRLYPFIRISRKFIDRKRIKMLFNYSVFTFITRISDELIFNVDNFVIVIFIGLPAVTVYSIAARLIKNVMGLMSGLFRNSIPLFSQYEGRGDFASIQDKYQFLTKISTYFSFLIGGMLIILGKPLIDVWVGPRYEQAYPILLILLIPFIFDIMQMPGTAVLYGVSKHRYYAALNVAQGVANLLLSIYLVRRYGLYGVALGTAIPMFIVKVFIQPLLICRVVKMPYRVFYLNLMLPRFLLGGGLLFLFWLAVKGLIRSDVLTVGGLGMLGVIFYSAIIYWAGFSDFERRKHFKPLLAFAKKQAV